jgi:RES domain-containing protein
VRFVGQVFRAHHPRWAFLPTSGQGAALHGGRFNPQGMPALYTSLHLETAWLEAQQAFPFKAQPMTLVAYAVDCEPLANLADASTLSTLGIAPGELACAWEAMADRGADPPSWSIARRLFNDGYAGILVQSFAHGASVTDVNAVFWRWSDSPPHQVRVIDDHSRLPKDDQSWR